jgi:hypothetical protein
MPDFYETPVLIEYPPLTDVTGASIELSDRNSKTGIRPVESRVVLELLAGLPISNWSHEAEDGLVRHIGPMAQDFEEIFGVGKDDTHIHTVDANGVALAAIQGLFQVLQEKDAQLEAQGRQIAALEARLAALEQRQAGAVSLFAYSGRVGPFA